MSRLAATATLLIAANALTALVFHLWVYDFLDDYIYDQYSLQLEQARAEIDTRFDASEPDQWQTVATEIEALLDTSVAIHSRDSDKLPDDIESQLAQTLSENGVIDPVEPIIYYPLGDQYIAEINPIVTDAGTPYLTEWSSWAASVLIALAILWISNRYTKAHTETIRNKLVSMLGRGEDASTDGDDFNRILSMLNSFDRQHRRQSEINEDRLISQRDLLHGVAHEFRSPMARIQFALDLLDDAEDDERSLLMDKLHGDLEELDTMVKELLSYSRLQHGEVELDLSKHALAELIQDAIEKVQDFYPEVDYRCRVPEEILCRVDRKLALRVIVNILRNAGRFAQHRCEITVSRESLGIRVSIDDDGPGIPPGKRDRILEPFTRLDPSRSRDSGGSGLGLAIVNRIMVLHRGEVHIDDSPMGGARIELLFPD